MLHVTVEGQTYKFDASKLLNTEAIALQKTLGMRIPEWFKALQESDAYAVTGLVWLIYRRNGRETAFDDIEFDINSIDIVDDEEKTEPDPTEGVAVSESPPSSSNSSGTTPPL